MKKLFTKRNVLAACGIVVTLLVVSYMNAKHVAIGLIGRQPPHTIAWFQPLQNGQVSPRWGFTFWSGGMTNYMIAEVHVSLFGKIKYKKGWSVSNSSIHGIEY